MKHIHEWLNTGLILVVAALVLVGGNQSAVEFGATGTRMPNGISADTTSPIAGQVRGTTLTMTGDATLGGGDDALSLTSTNAATSSIAVGCIELANGATSTATKAKLMLFASSTLNIDGASITAGFGGGTMQGLALWGYGTCP